MDKRHTRPSSDLNEPHSSNLYKRKKTVLKPQHKIIIIFFFIILVFIAFFFIQVMKEKHQAEKKAKEANFSFAKILKEKAKFCTEKKQWQLAKLYTVNSMFFQAKAQLFLPMNDIVLPPDLQHNEVDYITFLHRPNYRENEILKLLKEVEQQTGLVLDGTDPVGTDIYYSLDLDYYKNSSKYNSAVEAYNVANDFYNSGSYYLEQQNYPEAIANLTRSLKIRPNVKEALNKLAWAYLHNGDKGKSKKIYKRAKKLNFDYFRKWNSKQWADRGDRQKEESDFMRAIRSYQEALKINPNYYRVWNSLGETFEQINKIDRAINTYRQALSSLPGLAREWESKIAYNQALKYVENAQYQQAIKFLKKSIQLNPKLHRAWLKLSGIYQTVKKEKRAYRGERGDFYFKQTDLKLALIFIARQTGISIFMDPTIDGQITCELDQVKWDQVMDLFININNYYRVRYENIFIIGKNPLIEKFSRKKSILAGKSPDIFSGKPIDLSFFNADIQFVLQSIAAKANLKIITGPGINHNIVCEISQLPWDMALDFLLEMNDLSCFPFSNLIFIERKDVLERKCKSEEGILEIFQSLLQLDYHQVKFKDKLGKTLLFFAAEKGFPRLAAFLISKGAKVNTRDKWNFTPLHEALNKETAEILTSSGALLNVQSNSGFTPLQSAVYGLRLDVARFLVKKGAVSNIFLDTAIGRFEKVQQQVLKNLNIINTRGMGGWTLLHHASAAGQYEIAEFLLSKNADINAATTRGETSLHLAVSRGRRKIVKLLILNGANVNLRNKYGNTPLHIAKTNKDSISIKLLKKYGGHD